jgi:hypothetical protein
MEFEPRGQSQVVSAGGISLAALLAQDPEPVQMAFRAHPN